MDRAYTKDQAGQQNCQIYVPRLNSIATSRIRKSINLSQRHVHATKLCHARLHKLDVDFERCAEELHQWREIDMHCQTVVYKDGSICFAVRESCVRWKQGLEK